MPGQVLLEYWKKILEQPITKFTLAILVGYVKTANTQNKM